MMSAAYSPHRLDGPRKNWTAIAEGCTRPLVCASPVCLRPSHERPNGPPSDEVRRGGIDALLVAMDVPTIGCARRTGPEAASVWRPSTMLQNDLRSLGNPDLGGIHGSDPEGAANPLYLRITKPETDPRLEGLEPLFGVPQRILRILQCELAVLAPRSTAVPASSAAPRSP
jgi:hypothetical protein